MRSGHGYDAPPADMLGLIGTNADAVDFVEKARTGAAMESRIATGMPAEEGPPAIHK